MHSWVIGRGGMLGASVEKCLMPGSSVFEPKNSFSWNDPIACSLELQQEVERFNQIVGDKPWSIYWCAGAGTVTASEEVLRNETAILECFLAAIKNSTGLRCDLGHLFYSSSAGGVYAGASSLPITERSEIAPRSTYGLQKLKNEELLGAFAHQNGVRVLLGRIANLYGPNQNRSKGQGLITAICQSHILRKPANIFVGLDTVRNYIYVDDAAESIVRSMNSATKNPVGSVETKIIASKQNLTISAVLKDCQAALGSAPSVVLSRSQNQAAYPPDLRMKSVHIPDADNYEPTPLVVGAHRVYQSLLQSHRAGLLVDVRS
jgi:UDP-glucose 4-epimerase